jgi:hypothetical protein
MRSFKKLDPKRRGMILYVIVVLLTLFLVVGMCFVLMAESQATASRIYREAAVLRDDYPTPQEMFGWALGSVIYDATDQQDTLAPNGQFNAIRGHGLARNMYGWNYNPNANGSLTGIGNSTAFNGAGRLHMTGANARNPWAASLGLDDFDLPNATYNSSDGFNLMPERDKNNLFTGGANAPYTYPDKNNWYLGAVDSNGTVLTRSFWRDNTAFGSLDPANPNWYAPGTGNNAALKYMTMRPRPADQVFPSEQNAATIQTLVQQGVIFPAPTDANGDVRNLPGTGPNDSVWIDLGYPARRLKFSNRWVKPLFAILIVDLDNRINLNVSGNTKESQDLNYHGSVQGWGRWEINPTKLMANPIPGGGVNEYLNLFRGTTLAGNNYPGRFGFAANTFPDQPPGQGSGPGFFPVPDRFSQVVAPPTAFPKNYGRVDYDGSRYYSNAAGPPFPPPYQTANRPPPGNYPYKLPIDMTTAFPDFGTPGQTRYNDGNPFERWFHASLFNPFNLNLGAGFSYTDPQADQNLPIGDLRYLLQYNTAYDNPADPSGVPNELRNSRIGKLWPTLLYSDRSLFRRITPYSMDMDVAGAAPGTVDAAGIAGPYQLTYFDPMASAWVPYVPGNPNAAPPFLPQSQGQPITFGALVPNRQATPNPGGDLRNNDWRSILPDFGRVDLNRQLTAFPAPPQTGFRFTAAQTDQVNQAQKDRVLLAQDIFLRLVKATGATDPGTITSQNIPPGDARFEATRYLAQLAANIVDYIDEDDYSTAFNWLSYDANGNLVQPQSLTQPYPALPVNPNGWVFGTELPRVVINEVYGQAMNDPDDTFPGTPVGASAGYKPGDTGDPDTDDDARPFKNVAGYPNAPNYTSRHATTQPQPLDYRVNFFVELHDPHVADPNLSESGAARLQLCDPGVAPLEQGVYQIQIMSQVDKAALRSAGNVTGAATPKVAKPNINITVGNFDPDGKASPSPGAAAPPDKYTYTVQPANKQYANPPPVPGSGGFNTGYYVIGPSVTTAKWQADFPHERGGAAPATAPPVTLSPQDVAVPAFPAGSPPQAQFPGFQNRMHTTLPINTALSGQPGLNGIAGNQDYQCTVLLRRLANPNVAGNNDATQSFYNPFVTVDYLDGINVYDATLYDDTRPRDGQGTPARPLRHRMSDATGTGYQYPRETYGRLQPFRAVVSPSIPSISPSKNPNLAPNNAMPWNTLTRQNGDNPYPTQQPGGQNVDEWFDWPTHLDRQVSSPMELLNVSGFKPHEYTQQFILGVPNQPFTAAGQRNVAPNTPAKNKHKHLAPWFDYMVDDSTPPGTTYPLQTRLSRALELLGAGDRTQGVAFGGRVMGKVNINTVWSTNLSGGTVGQDNQQILRALADAMGVAGAADPRSGNFFTQTDVDNLFSYLVRRRTLSTNGVPNGVPGTNDRPFWSLAVPNALSPQAGATPYWGGTPDAQYPLDTTNNNPPAATLPTYPPSARGLNRTFLGDVIDPAKPNSPPFQMTDIVDPTGTNHPYIQKELLQKLSGHLTTRSNTFAVFVTTGFFNVRDPAPASGPPKLGSELTLNTTDPTGPMRHKMFAIVDRTNLTQDINNLNPTYNNARLQGPRPIYFPYTPVDGKGTPQSQTDASVQVTLSVPGYGIGPNGGVMVRDTIDHNGDLSRAGNVDNVFTDKSGEWFEIVANRTKLFLGNGDATNPNSDAEVVTVTAAGQLGQNFVVQFNATKRHARGAAVCTQQVGNPGPQPLPINYESPPYSNSVVPFRQILQ